MVLALLPASVVAAGPTGALPELPTLPEPPRIDGSIEPAEWRGALHVNDFHETSEALKAIGIPRALRTGAYVAQSDSAFHFAFDCFHDRMRELTTAATEHDGPVWGDDSVEVFLDAHGTRYSYYHIIVNAAGCLTDAFNSSPHRRDATWDADAQAAGRVHADRFTIELSLPFHALNLGLNRQSVIGLNLCRNVCYSKGRQSWRGGFHDPANAAALRVNGVGPSRFPVALESTTWGNLAGTNDVTMCLRNLGNTSLSLTGQLKMVQGVTEREQTFSHDAAPGQTCSLRLAYNLAETDRVRCRLTLYDERMRVVAVIPRILWPKAIATVTVNSDMLLRTDRPRVSVRLNVPRTELKQYAIELVLLDAAGGEILRSGPIAVRRASFAEELDLSTVPADADRVELQTVLRNVKTGATVLDSRIPLRIVPSPWVPAR